MTNKTCLIISILAAFIACVADVFLLYEPNARYEQMDYTYLANFDSQRLLWGHYLGILAIPFELLGLWVVAQRCRNISPQAPFWITAAMVFVLIVGVAYHACIIFVAHIFQWVILNQETLVLVKSFFEPLGTGLALTFLVLSSLFAYAILKRKVELSKWLVFANPILVYGLCLVAYLISPTNGGILLVAGFNFSILVLLTAVLVDVYYLKEKI